MRLLPSFLLATAMAGPSVANEVNHVCDIYPECRGLTDGEITLARNIFGDTIDYDGVSIINGRYLGIFPIGDEYTGMAPDGDIYAVKESVQSADYSLEPDKQRFFIHEMTHVWQTASGVNVIASGFGLNMAQGRNSYVYDISDKTVFAEQSIEQQARIVENYFLQHRSLLQGNVQQNEQARESECGDYLLHYEAVRQALPVPAALTVCL